VVVRQSYNHHEHQVPKEDQLMGAFGMPTQVLRIIPMLVDRLYDWEAPCRCPILHLMIHHLFDRFSYRRNQCHLCRVARHATRLTSPYANWHHYDNV
jgi:hypothetical protein